MDATGTFHSLPAVAVEPFRELFAHKVLKLLLARGKITPDVLENIRSWKHSGFSVDKSVRIEAGDRAGLERLLRYIVRCPFSIERVANLGPGDSVIYRAADAGAGAAGVALRGRSRLPARASPPVT